MSSTFTCPPLFYGSPDVWTYNIVPAAAPSVSTDSGIASPGLLSESSRTSSPVEDKKIKSDEDDAFCMDVLMSCVEMAMDNKDELEVKPKPRPTPSPHLSIREQFNLWCAQNYRMPKPAQVGSIPLLDGETFPMAGNAPVWPNFDMKPDKRVEAELREKFRHGEAKLNRLYRNYKTTMCLMWQRDGYCARNDKCAFAHGQHELRCPKILNPEVYRTRVCSGYATGYCRYGDKCTFLHPKRY